MLSLFVIELFGNKEYEKFIGIYAASSTAGFAVGSPFGNICYDILGSYNFSFYVFLALMLFTTIAMQYVLFAAKRERKIIENALLSDKN